MERLTESSLLAADGQADPRASGWLTDNVLHPFVNGTGLEQIYNNFVSDKNKVEPAYVPEAKTLSGDWAVHTLASASGAVLTYALAGKAAGMGLGAAAEAAGLEGASARAMTSVATAQILGAGLYDFAKAPNQGETRLGNALGTMAAFGAFAGGNALLGRSETIARSTLLTGLGRVGVGMAGGLTALETSHLVSNALGVKNDVSWQDAYKSMASGGFINVAMPVVQKGVSDMVDGALNAKPFKLSEEQANQRLAEESRGQLPQMQIEDSGNKGPQGFAKKFDIPDDLEKQGAKGKDAIDPKARPTRDAGSDADLPKLILLKQQFNEAERQAQIERVAGELADFIGESKKTLHTAIYDFRLKDPKVEDTVVNALNSAAERGVDVKIAFFQPPEKPAVQGVAHTTDLPGEGPLEEEPLSQGPSQSLLAKLSPKIGIQRVTIGDSAATSGIPDAFHDIIGHDGESGGPISSHLLDLQGGNHGSLGDGVGTNGITGGGKLMHDKYVVRDSGTKDGAVWTGSTNFTDDAFGSQDNNIIQFKNAGLAKVFDQDFQEMWKQGSIARTGKDLHSTVNVGDGQVTVAFSPGDGAYIDSEYAKRVAEAKNSVHIASMVISSPEMLKALADKIDEGVPVTGIYDGPQMANVARAWGRSQSDASQEKLTLWNKVKGNLVAKHSHPYKPEGIHDFMHDKMLTVDDKVAATGSFNISMNATHNAENVLIMDNMPDVATQYRSYIDDLVKTYGNKGNGRTATAKN